jgi:hydroxymethylbilane synthase
MINTLRIATRQSPLALWQANYVAKQIQLYFPDIQVALVKIVTTADKMSNLPLDKIGGKGLFVKELEIALLNQQADIAVHSIKDMPAQLPEGLTLATVCQRQDSRDAFISNQYSCLIELPAGSTIGTSSLRRKSQILALRPDLLTKNLRGNVGTRLQKLDAGDFDAIVLAVAGIHRLDLEQRINSIFEMQQMLPAAGQGAIGIECRIDDKEVLSLLAPLNDRNTHQAILAERELTKQLGSSCQYPIAAYASVTSEQLQLQGLVANLDGSIILRASHIGPVATAIDIGDKVAKDLISQGAIPLLQQVLRENSAC